MKQLKKEIRNLSKAYGVKKWIVEATAISLLRGSGPEVFAGTVEDLASQEEEDERNT